MIIILSKQLELQVNILNTNNLHTVVWLQVFPSNIFQTILTGTTTLDSVDLGVMGTKE